MEKKKYRGFRDLIVYQLSYQLAVEIFEITKTFPKDHKYISEERHYYFISKYEEVSKMLNSMINTPEKFCY